MQIKEKLRKLYIKKREKNYFEINESFFNPLFRIIKTKIRKKIIKIGIYHPYRHELNVLKILKFKKNKNKIKILLPEIKMDKKMVFYDWQENSPLKINKFGILEPINCKLPKIPDVILAPLVAFDKFKNRLGYGKGFYDNYLKVNCKTNKIMSIGVGFSFQEYSEIPINTNDKKMSYILTDKGIIK